MLRINSIALIIPLAAIGFAVPALGQAVAGGKVQAPVDGQVQGHIVDDGDGHGDGTNAPPPQNAGDLQSALTKALQDQVDRLAADLGCTDQEFAQLRPSLFTIVDYKSREANRTSVLKRSFATGDPAARANVTPVQRAFLELTTASNDPNSTADFVAAKLAGYRAAWAANQEAIATAENNLKPLLSVRQESVLILDGLMQ